MGKFVKQWVDKGTDKYIKLNLNQRMDPKLKQESLN